MEIEMASMLSSHFLKEIEQIKETWSEQFSKLLNQNSYVAEDDLDGLPNLRQANAGKNHHL